LGRWALGQVGGGRRLTCYLPPATCWGLCSLCFLCAQQATSNKQQAASNRHQLLTTTRNPQGALRSFSFESSLRLTCPSRVLPVLLASRGRLTGEVCVRARATGNVRCSCCATSRCALRAANAAQEVRPASASSELGRLGCLGAAGLRIAHRGAPYSEHGAPPASLLSAPVPGGASWCVVYLGILVFCL
jgi:hypothetical protein